MVLPYFFYFALCTIAHRRLRDSIARIIVSRKHGLKGTIPILILKTQFMFLILTIDSLTNLALYAFSLKK